jgi:hypothetical protein
MGASLVGDDVWEYQFSEYQEAPSYPKLTLNNKKIKENLNSLLVR